jgi:hypothetical protein
MVLSKLQSIKRPKLVAKGLERIKDNTETIASKTSESIIRSDLSNLKNRILQHAYNNPKAFGESIRPKAKQYGILLKPIIRELVLRTNMTEFLNALGPEVVEFLDGLGEYKYIVFGFPRKVSDLFDLHNHPVGDNISDFFKIIGKNKAIFVKYVNSLDPYEFGQYLLTANQYNNFLFIDLLRGLGKNIGLFVKTMGEERLALFHRGLYSTSKLFAIKAVEKGIDPVLILQLTGFDPKDLKTTDFI